MIHTVTLGEGKCKWLHSWLRCALTQHHAARSGTPADSCYSLDFVSVSASLTTRWRAKRRITVSPLPFFPLRKPTLFHSLRLRVNEHQEELLGHSHGRPAFLAVRPGRENGPGHGGRPPEPRFSWLYICNGTSCFHRDSPVLPWLLFNGSDSCKCVSNC